MAALSAGVTVSRALRTGVGVTEAGQPVEQR
jgi:hypothetical protein